MNSIIVQNENLSIASRQAPAQAVDGQELEQIVGVALLGDLNTQLADISEAMERQVQDKQTLRAEMETLYRLRQDKEALNIEGQSYRDFSPQEAELLGVTRIATPQTDEQGRVTGFRIKDELFKEANDSQIKIREEQISELNGNAELVMLKIQSLVEQRKNALTLLSNLMASANDVAQNIIGNIRN